jgi:hypothetical protein
VPKPFLRRNLTILNLRNASTLDRLVSSLLSYQEVRTRLRFHAADRWCTIAKGEWYIPEGKLSAELRQVIPAEDTIVYTTIELELNTKVNLCCILDWFVAITVLQSSK